jgi:hypothetical protein
MRVTFDSKAFHAALKAGHGAEVLRAAARAKGLHFHDRDFSELALDAVKLVPRNSVEVDGQLEFAPVPADMAYDAQPELVTVANAGIPAFLTNWVDPKLIEVLVSPMKAARIYGEEKKGDWTTEDIYFSVIESQGEVSSYGDFNSNGSVEVNSNFPQRQTYHYQTFTQWGEREMAKAALAKIDQASRLNIASALLLNKFQNASYFFGISGLQIYGGLNDPTLYAPIAATAPWNSETDPVVIYDDIRRLFQQIVSQANSTVELDDNARIVLAMSATNQVNLKKANQFNESVLSLLKTNFPNIRFETAPEFSTASGEVVQMIVEELEGQETCTCSFTEKMRAHAVVQDTSSWKQKKSQGTSGFVLFRSFLIGQMTTS